ncbi:hypothetical protein OG417_14550 [Actinoallomurus sp. NBC_01490]|uniref:hypothetical protein n=1 Tax=Actinoallomurus sp. NBC_01490 TaxID=2903557 RepID=UPI002E2FE609|nr:hypothetical protein [Actinoallomurus sp. NBC_01490]
MSSTPVAIRPSASRPSSPTHAVDQCAAVVLAGSPTARTNSHGISASPKPIRPSPTQHALPRHGADVGESPAVSEGADADLTQMITLSVSI